MIAFGSRVPRAWASIALAALFASLLPACGGTTAIRGAVPVEDARLVSYTMRGRFALRQGSEAASGRIDWARRPGEEQVLLLDPLGTGIGELTQRADGARLKLADGRRYEGENGEELLAAVTGMRIPLGVMGVWLAGKGLGDGSVSELERDQEDRVSRFRHDGWQVEYRYREADALPSTVRARRDDGTEIRLAIESWELPNE